MRLLFICGSLEPGKDGVGDYTRRLCGCLIEYGHQAYILAFNDPFVMQETWETQLEETVEIEVLRLPVHLSVKRKTTTARSWIKTIEPDWISLQYVPFAYQSKGLPFLFAIQIQKIGKEYKWQVMFHELWTGMDIAAGIKDKLIGVLQKIVIYQTIKVIKPSVIHTQSSVYQAQIRRISFQAKVLPLFGNIPFRKHTAVTRKRYIFIFFGGIHLGGPIESFAKALSSFIKRSGTTVEIWFVGRNGTHLHHWLAILKMSDVPVRVFGELPTSEVSDLFQVAYAGLSTTPVALAQKSGSIAAMLEHKMKVLCIANSWKPGNLNYKRPILPVTEYDRNFNFQKFFDEQPLIDKFVNVTSVAHQFLEDLNIRL